MFIASKLGQTSQSELLECEFECRLSRWKRQTNFFQENALLSFGVRLPFLPLAFFKVSLLSAGVFWLPDLHCTMKTPVPFPLKDLYLYAV